MKRPNDGDRSADGAAPYDIAVVGGGPAGVAAALWAARYRRRVVVLDAGEARNRWSTAAHGYLGLEGADPAQLREVGRQGLRRYAEIDVVDGCLVREASRGDDDVFRLQLDDGRVVRALRLVLATGVRDVFPDVDGFEHYFGRSVFTCPSCDGYEGQGRRVAVVGTGPDIVDFAVGLLDWASSVVVVHGDRSWSFDDRAAGASLDDVAGDVVAILGRDGEVQSLQLDDGRTVPCEVVFWSMEHRQHSELAAQLGCAMTAEGSVDVDEHGATSVPGVYAAGDMTPGAHLIQLAAADGARAGIAAATSLRGHSGSPDSPRPAPSPDDVTGLIAR